MLAQAGQHHINSPPTARDDTSLRIPECPPEPRSLWIDLYPINDVSGQFVPEDPPDPPYIFLDLQSDFNEAAGSEQI